MGMDGRITRHGGANGKRTDLPQARRRTNCGHADFRPSADGRADRHFRLA